MQWSILRHATARVFADGRHLLAEKSWPSGVTHIHGASIDLCHQLARGAEPRGAPTGLPTSRPSVVGAVLLQAVERADFVMPVVPEHLEDIRVKALTVQQPWAWAIIHGPKRIENRTWATGYRGTLLIHAGMSRVRLGHYGRGEPSPDDLIFGCLIGTVELVDCVPVAKAPRSRFAEGPWCWLLSDPKPLRHPIPYRGRQLLFDVSDMIVENESG